MRDTDIETTGLEVEEVAGQSTAADRLPRPWRASGWLLVFALIGISAFFLYLFGYGVYIGMAQGALAADDAEALVTARLQSLDGLVGVYTLQFVCLVPVILLAAHFKRQSWRETLAIKAVPVKVLGLWLGVWAVYQLIAFGMHLIFDIPVDAFMKLMSGSRHLWVSLVVVLLAPVLEELVFRGYLFKAWRSTWLGASGTIALTSILFLLLHWGQYNPVILGQLLVFAIILGVSREKTGSLVSPGSYTSPIIYWRPYSLLIWG